MVLVSRQSRLSLQHQVRKASDVFTEIAHTNRLQGAFEVAPHKSSAICSLFIFYVHTEACETLLTQCFLQTKVLKLSMSLPGTAVSGHRREALEEFGPAQMDICPSLQLAQLPFGPFLSQGTLSLLW